MWSDVLQECGRARSAAASEASVSSELFPAMLPAPRDKLRKAISR